MFGANRILAIALVVFSSSVSVAQIADPPGTAGLMGKYRAWFATVDSSKDGIIDKEELARVFRGPNAKPFDYVPPAKDKPEEKKSDENKTETTSPTPTKPAPKANYSQYPDYNFLIQLDKNGDEQLSRDEFEDWARDLSLQIKNQLEAQQRLLQLQQKLSAPPPNKKLSSNEKQKLEAEKKKVQAALRKEHDQNEKLKDRLERLQKNFRQAQKKQNDKKKR